MYMSFLFQAAVYEDYACMLNQSNIWDNHNKFYEIQLIKTGKIYVAFTKWGRVVRNIAFSLFHNLEKDT